VEKTSLRSRYRASLRATLTLLVALPMMSTAATGAPTRQDADTAGAPRAVSAAVVATLGAPSEVRPVAAARPVADERVAQSGGYTMALASPVPPGASATFPLSLKICGMRSYFRVP